MGELFLAFLPSVLRDRRQHVAWRGVTAVRGSVDRTLTTTTTTTHPLCPPTNHRYILEILIRAALKEGRNVLVQGSLRDSAWHAAYFKELRARGDPGLRIAIVHVRYLV